MQWRDPKLVEILKGGGVAVMPTDTLYGIVGRAENLDTVERIYKIRHRAQEKPCIILISGISDLKKFDIVLSHAQAEKIQSFAEPTSFILDCPDSKFSYLHRGTKTLAFRIPQTAGLQGLLKQTGPLIAPSANLEALPPSKGIAEARAYFGNLVDLYLDGDQLGGKASKLVRLREDGSSVILRA